MQWHGFPTGSLTPGHDARPASRSLSTTTSPHRPRLEAEAVAGLPLGWTRGRSGHAVDAGHAVAFAVRSGGLRMARGCRLRVADHRAPARVVDRPSHRRPPARAPAGL